MLRSFIMLARVASQGSFSLQPEGSSSGVAGWHWMIQGEVSDLELGSCPYKQEAVSEPCSQVTLVTTFFQLDSQHHAMASQHLSTGK